MYLFWGLFFFAYLNSSRSHSKFILLNNSLKFVAAFSLNLKESFPGLKTFVLNQMRIISGGVCVNGGGGTITLCKCSEQ